MDFNSILNADSVDPNPRRFSNSQTPISATESPASVQNGAKFPGVKRPISSSTAGDEQPSPKKVMTTRVKKRPMEKPAWAHKWTEIWHRQHGGRNAAIQSRQSPVPSNGTPVAQLPPQRASSVSNVSNRPSSSSQDAPSALMSSQYAPSALTPSVNPARPEPSYLNINPADEAARTIADFLYTEVVAPGWLQNSNEDCEVEIEAKLGKIIDKNTNERIRLPVRHECVLFDSGLHIAFRSSMTSLQHRAMNEHLNKAVQSSLPQKDSGQPASGVRRQPMGYKHLYELDRFYALPHSTFNELPPRLRSLVAQAKQRPRVRISWNTKTDQIIAKIIKIRVCDVHVYNPQTAFDWRVSVSLEVRYDGDVNSLIPDGNAGRARHGRKKDRMSYTHQGIRIDLTQVTMSKDADENAKSPPEVDLEHELELELPVEALKEEASKLPADGEGYKSLTKLFVDNVRMATRQFPAQ